MLQKMQTISCLSEVGGVWNMFPIKLAYSYTYDKGENRNNLKSDNLIGLNKGIWRSTCAIRHVNGTSVMWKSLQTWTFDLHFTIVTRKFMKCHSHQQKLWPMHVIYIVRGWPIKYKQTPSCWVSFNDCKTSSYCKIFTNGIRWQWSITNQVIAKLLHNIPMRREGGGVKNTSGEYHKQSINFKNNKHVGPPCFVHQIIKHFCCTNYAIDMIHKKIKWCIVCVWW